MGRRISRLVVVCWLLGVGGRTAPAWDEEAFRRKPAVRHVLVETDSAFGELRAYRVKKGDTLFDIARNYSLGYGEIVESNQGLDVWLPPPGAVVLLPTSWLLPCCDRRGIVINIPEMRLYYIASSKETPGVAEVVTYPVGLGREEWQTPRGKFKVRSKTENPTWVIPESIREERIAEHGDTRTFIPGGAADNPLGQHRLALTMPGYAIHGTNIPWGVGMQVSHGCVRLYPEDIERLFAQVPVGTPGEFVYQPVKVGLRAGEVFVEASRDIYGLTPALWKEARGIIDRLGVAERVDDAKLMEALQHPTGIPVSVSGTPDTRRLASVGSTGEVGSDARIPDTVDGKTADD